MRPRKAVENHMNMEEKVVSAEPKKSKKLSSTREEELKKYMKQGFVDVSDSRPGIYTIACLVDIS